MALNSWIDKGVHTSPKGIGPKVNVIARPEFKLAYYNVQLTNHYTLGTDKRETGEAIVKEIYTQIHIVKYHMYQQTKKNRKEIVIN